MAKKNKREIDPLISEIMDKYGVENIFDLQSIMKDLLKDGVSMLLDTEMEETLGFSKHQRSPNKNMLEMDITLKMLKLLLVKLNFKSRGIGMESLIHKLSQNTLEIFLRLMIK